MKNIKVSKKDLLQKIKANRAARIKEVEDLQCKIEPYNTKILAELVKYIQKNNKLSEPLLSRIFKQELKIDTKKYDNLIAMFEASLDDELSLTLDQFNDYMLDLRMYPNYAIESFKALLNRKE